MIFDGIETKKILQYIKERYAGEPEFLWAKSPDSAVFRHRDSLKWYGVLLNIPKRKLGLADDGNADILVLKCDPIMIGSIKDGIHYFSAYHMNKEHWITVLLNENIQFNNVFALIEISFNITKKSKTHFSLRSNNFN